MVTVSPIGNGNMPSESWQIFQHARKILGLSMLQRLFGNRSATQLRRWGRNPSFSADWQRNPIDWLRLLSKQLKEEGAEDVAIAMVQILAEPLGLRVALPDTDEPQRDNIQGQFVDVFRNLNLMMNLAEAGEHPNLVDQSAAKATKEVESFQKLYRQLWCDANEGGCKAQFSLKQGGLMSKVKAMMRRAA